MNRFYAVIFFWIISIPGLCKADVAYLSNAPGGNAGPDATTSGTSIFKFTTANSSNNFFSFDSIKFTSANVNLQSIAFKIFLSDGVTQVGQTKTFSNVTIDSSNSFAYTFNLNSFDTTFQKNTEYKFSTTTQISSGFINTNLEDRLASYGSSNVFASVYNNNTLEGLYVSGDRYRWQFNVTATVPEPTTMVLTGAAIGLVFGGRFLRKWKKSPSSVD